MPATVLSMLLLAISSTSQLIVRGLLTLHLGGPLAYAKYVVFRAADSPPMTPMQAASQSPLTILDSILRSEHRSLGSAPTTSIDDEVLNIQQIVSTPPRKANRRKRRRQRKRENGDDCRSEMLPSSVHNTSGAVPLGWGKHGLVPADAVLLQPTFPGNLIGDIQLPVTNADSVLCSPCPNPVASTSTSSDPYETNRKRKIVSEHIPNYPSVPTSHPEADAKQLASAPTYWNKTKRNRKMRRRIEMSESEAVLHGG
jgi:hypothetical protein